MDVVLQALMAAGYALPEDSTVIPVTIFHGSRKGAVLGYVTDLIGNHLADVSCPTDGAILYKTFNLPIKKADGLFSIGHIN